MNEWKMPRTYSSIEKIRAELTWVNETPDPNKCVVATFDAVKKLNTTPEHVRPLSRQSSGRYDGSTTVRHTVNMHGVEARPAAIWSRGKSTILWLG